MKSRGRGGHKGGRGGGFRADRDGPKLPSSLLAALGHDSAPAQLGRGRGRGGSRKQSRKLEREGLKAARLKHQKARAASKKRPHPDGGAQQQPGPKRHATQAHGNSVTQQRDKPVKKQVPQQQQQQQKQQKQKPSKAGQASASTRAGVPGGSSKTHFHELLPGGALGASVQGANSAAAYIADLIAARTAEKKLGIKKGGALKGPSDGLSHFLSGLSTASGTTLPDYINVNDPVVQRVLPADVLCKAHTAGERIGAEEPVGPIETDSEDEFGLGVLMGGGDESSSEEGEEEGGEGEESDKEGSEDGDGMGDEEEDAGGSEGDGDEDSEGVSSDGEGGSDKGPSGDSELQESRGGVRGESSGDEDEDEEESDGGGEDKDGAGSSEEGGELQEGKMGEVLGGSEGLRHHRGSSSGGESAGEEDSEEDEGEESGSSLSGEEDGDEGSGSSGGEEEVQTDIYGRTKGDPPLGGEGAWPGRYVPPALRAAQQRGGGASSALERRITGLLNRLAEANMSGVAKDMAALYEEHGRRAVGSVVVSQLTQAAARGPRATEQFAATAAAFVAALAVLARAPELVASFLETCAQDLEAALESKDGLARHNLSMVIAHCYSCGMMGADMVYSLLNMLRERFTEDDVQVMDAAILICIILWNNVYGPEVLLAHTAFDHAEGMWWLPTAGELLEQGPPGGRPGVGGGAGGQQGLLTAMANDLTLDLGDNGADLLQVRGARRTYSSTLHQEDLQLHHGAVLGSQTHVSVVDFSQLDSKAEQFWYTLFRFLLGSCKTLQDVKDIFSRAAQQAKQLGTFLPSLLLFLRTKLGPWLAGVDEGQAAVGKVGQEELLARLLVAEQIVGGGASNSTAFL
ncbi:hypothetical protein DUNSADRAFT_17436 [Dunaliella salina]|uniref:MIF4G domain-containing protein n=1 Tax=Dunaliella salina TaxID=3046 RepID=A0ABQ7H034_DUNSA|nr:hypothetical protein DUNSADRAFT_17436 [Dunaliella salina]|eukprot:KAF5840219.1 hypothetical protein DUNSADRAFT_17436 [Dunaliella salina]